MRKLTYKINGYTQVYNPNTETVEKQETLATVEAFCENPTQFNECYSAAEKVAVGEIIVEGEYTEEQTVEERTAALEEALTLLLEGATE